MRKFFSTLAAALALSAASAPAQTADSPWPRSHRTPGQQASTPLPGPVRGEVEVRLFTEDAGKAFGTSPYTVLSERKYPARPRARTLWGASLTDVFKYEIDGDTFRYVDSFEINKLPIWIGWNLFRLPGGRTVVPNPSGLRIGKYRGTPCYGTSPSLLVFTDDDTPGSPIRCVHKFEFTKDALEASCGFRKVALGRTAVFTGELPSGAVAVTVIEKRGRTTRPHVAVLDTGLTRILACAPLGAEGQKITNQMAVERAPDGSDLAYFALEDTLVVMRYDPRDNSLRPVGEADVRFRARTGTTPTLVDTPDGRRLLVTVDGRCAVDNVFTGAIKCSPDTRPAELVVLDRTDLSAPPLRVALPDIFDTVENSPAAYGGDVVVANYSGYSPDGKKDGRRDFARGVAMLRWNGSTFAPVWVRDDIQISGVPTISAGSRMVYSSGGEADRNTYVYGLDLATGQTRMRAFAGPSENTSNKRKDGVFDAGNNTVINDDGTAIFPAGETLVRVR